jgi:CheY-like chemotaxis protein
MTILLVDDDEDDKKLFFEAAKEVDDAIACIAASNGHDALQYLKDTANPLPDYVFLDLRMPGLSGRQCLIEIRKDPRLMAIPVMIYTTSRDVMESIELKELGATHFMSKPVSPDDVYYLISFALGERWS